MKLPEYPTSPPYAERLVVIKGGVSRALPYFYSFNDIGSIKWRLKEEQKGFAHGGVPYGDRKVESKKIKISLHIKGQTEQEYDRLFNELLEYFSGQDYRLICGRPDRTYRVEGLTEVKPKFIKGYKQRWSEVEITLLLVDPFRYAANATTINKDFSEEAQQRATIEIDNPSSVDVPLIWTFSPPENNATMDILITHEQTGQSFTLKDALLSHPAQATVNAEMGTVRRDNANSLNTFSGLFLHAEPGKNKFFYSGGKVKISVQYTARWLV